MWLFLVFFTCHACFSDFLMSQPSLGSGHAFTKSCGSVLNALLCSSNHCRLVDLMVVRLLRLVLSIAWTNGQWSKLSCSVLSLHISYSIFSVVILFRLRLEKQALRSNHRTFLWRTNLWICLSTSPKHHKWQITAIHHCSFGTLKV